MLGYVTRFLPLRVPASCRGRKGWVWYGTGRGVFNWGNGTTSIGHGGWRGCTSRIEDRRGDAEGLGEWVLQELEWRTNVLGR